MKLGILGGAFDPIHNGHLGLAIAAHDQFKLDRVLFVPTGLSPDPSKEGCHASAEERLYMARLATEDCSYFEVSDKELKMSGPSYTINTLKALKQENAQASLYLILGMDNFLKFMTWKDPKEIQQLATLVVAGRPHFKRETGIGVDVEWLQSEEKDFSSSKLRQCFQQNKPIAEQALPVVVENYIRQKSLYLKS